MAKIYTVKYYKGTRVYERPADGPLNGRHIERAVENEVDEKALQEELARRLVNRKNVIINK